MQEYIDVMKKSLDDGTNGFKYLVDMICELALKYRGSGADGKSKVLLGLKHDEQFVPIQINNADMQQNGNFNNPIFFKVQDLDPLYFSNRIEGGMAPVFIKLLQKIRDTLMKDDDRNKLLIICKYLREQVIPILEVLTKISKKKGGKEFIEQLDLRQLINELREIQKMEKEMENDEQMRANRRKEREDLMRTSTFNVKSFMPQVKSLVADKEFLKSGNRAQFVIGNKTVSIKGGRRTKRHKKRSGKRSGHKRSGKRSAHKRSGKRSGKR